METTGTMRSVLLADDNAVIRSAVSMRLSSLGHRVDAVRDGRQALEAPGRSRYDLVSLDVQMPEMGGIEAADRIASRSAESRPPRVVALTGDARATDLVGARGGAAVLSKPVRLADLMKLLAEEPGFGVDCP